MRALEDAHFSGATLRRPVTIVAAKGARLEDAEGKSYIDLAAAQGWANVGHSHPRVLAAIQEQAGLLVAHTESSYNDQRALWFSELTRALGATLGKSDRGDLTRVFPCSSGAEANEAGIKAARLFTGRSEMVALKRGFHGRTFGALSATANQKYREPFLPVVPGFVHVLPVEEEIEKAVTEETAGLIIEVVQGEGGVHCLPEEFLLFAQERCRKTGALLIVDEIQTGLGRTGRLFACEHSGVSPDLITLGKSLGGGIPMGALVWREELGTFKPGLHGSTFGGNPLACAASRAVLSVLQEEKLSERAARLGERIQSDLLSANLKAVREVRGLGLMIGVELRHRVTPVLKKLMDAGVWALPAGPTVLRLLPPLTILEEDLDTALLVVKEVLDG